MTHGEPARLVLLDGLRGIAAVGVVLFHAQLSSVWSVFSRGYLFVDLFFLLSGFVLALAFEPRLAVGLDARTFLVRRLRRFRPMVAAGALLGMLAMAAGPFDRLTAGLAFLLGANLIPQTFGGMLFPANPPQWSLLSELLANAAHARWLHRLSAPVLARIAMASALGMAIAMAHAGNGNQGASCDQVLTALLRAGWSYTLGVMLARRWRSRRPAPLADWRIALLAPLGVVWALPLLPLPTWAGDVLVITAVFPPLFWLAATATPPASMERLLDGLGAISFPLYAVHFPILLLANEMAGERGRVAGVGVALLVAMALAALTARGARLRTGTGTSRRPLIKA